LSEAPVGVLVMAHGTPRTLDELPGFYTEIRRGRPPSADQLTDLEARYRAIGGPSPLNAVTASQAAGIGRVLEEAEPGRFVVRHGSRFAEPRIEDAAEELAEVGASEVVGIVLAPHSSRASVGEYARRARDAAAAHGLRLEMVDHWYEVPGFAALVAGRVADAVGTLPVAARSDATVLFTAHSVPTALVDAGDDYPEQVATSARAVAEEAGLQRFAVAWQSAGRTEQQWLGPDVRDVIAAEGSRRVPGVVVCPIGFVSDHLEVLYDVDVEARAAADSAGMAFARTRSFNDDPEFCALLATVVRGRARPVA
jgi:ferrochelatase